MKKLLLTLALFSLVACAQPTLSPAKSFDDKLAYSEAIVTSVRSATASAVLDHEIASADGVRILTLTDQARALIDAAHDEGATPTGLDMLSQVTALLSVIQHDKAVPK